MPKQIKQDRVEEVKKILGEALWMAYCSGRAGNKYVPKEVLPDLLKKCQLFPQPLDKELREKTLLADEEILKFLPQKIKVAVLGKESYWRYRELLKAQVDKALALLQPKIEEAEKRGADSGVKAYESTCESLIVEAKKQGIRAAIDDLKMHYCIIDTEAKIKEIEEQALSGKGGK